LLVTLVLMQSVSLLHSNCWQAAAADAAVEVRVANARAERLEQELQLVRCVRHTSCCNVHACAPK
jgi:hypothetical protein